MNQNSELPVVRPPDGLYPEPISPSAPITSGEPSNVDGSSTEENKPKLRIPPKAIRALGGVTVALGVAGIVGWLCSLFIQNNSFITSVALLGIVCGLGIHDFLVGRVKQGLCHIVLTAAPFILEIAILFIGFLMVQLSRIFSINLSIPITNDQLLQISNFLIPIIYALNILWSLVEGLKFINHPNQIKLPSYNN